MFLPIQFRSRVAFSDYLKFHLSAYIFLRKIHKSNNFFGTKFEHYPVGYGGKFTVRRLFFHLRTLFSQKLLTGCQQNKTLLKVLRYQSLYRQSCLGILGVIRSVAILWACFFYSCYETRYKDPQCHALSFHLALLPFYCSHIFFQPCQQHIVIWSAPSCALFTMCLLIPDLFFVEMQEVYALQPNTLAIVKECMSYFQIYQIFCNTVSYQPQCSFQL